MPNGKCYVPYRLPGKYSCYICQDLKDADEFYKDSSRWNGCCSRCKKCDNQRREVRRTSEYQTDNDWSLRQERKRMDEIKGDTEGKDLIPDRESTIYTKVAMRDAQGIPVWIEKTIYHLNGDMEVRFEKGSQF